MKKPLLLLLLCIAGAMLCQAQGVQQLVTIPIGPGSTTQGWIYLPLDYATSGKKYPVVFFYHGVGAAGTDPNKLINDAGPAQLIAQGMRPDNIVNPVDGQPYSFIVVSAQHWSWSPNPSWLPTEVAWLKQNYRIDTNRIYVTGLSAGGQQSYNVAVDNDAVSSLIAAAVSMSPAALGSYDTSMIAKYKIRTWFLSGDQDAFTNNARTYTDLSNMEYANSSNLTVYSGGHCCWNTFYDVNYRDPVSGLSVWQWLLTNQRTNITLPTHFLSVKATPIGKNQVRVEFNVADVDAKVFYIEVSTDGVHFKRVAVTVPDNANPDKTYSQIITIQ